MYLCLRVLVTRLSGLLATILLSVALFLQLVDLRVPHDVFRESHYQSPLRNPNWSRAMASRNRIVTVPSLENTVVYPDDYLHFLELVARYGGSVSAGRVARRSRKAVNLARKGLYAELQLANLREDTLYVLNDQAYERFGESLRAGATCHDWDGYHVCFVPTTQGDRVTTGKSNGDPS